MTSGRHMGEAEGQPCRCSPNSPVSTVDSPSLEGLPSLILCLVTQRTLLGSLHQSYTPSTSPLLQVYSSLPPTHSQTHKLHL